MYLFSKPDGNVYNVQDGEFVQIGTLPLTTDMFINYSNADLDVSLIQSEPTITIHYYSTDNTLQGLELQANAVYTGKTVVQLDDYVLPSISAVLIKMFISLPSNATLRILLSSDKGNTWYTLQDNTWVEATLDSIATEGMHIDVVNSLSKSKLQELIPGAGTIRLAYYLEQSTSVDRVIIERTRVNYDLPQ